MELNTLLASLLVIIFLKKPINSSNCHLCLEPATPWGLLLPYGNHGAHPTASPPSFPPSMSLLPLFYLFLSKLAHGGPQSPQWPSNGPRSPPMATTTSLPTSLSSLPHLSLFLPQFSLVFMSVRVRAQYGMLQEHTDLYCELVDMRSCSESANLGNKQTHFKCSYKTLTCLEQSSIFKPYGKCNFL